MKVNLFRHANKELSQDAFLVWLLSWGAPECKGDLMYEYGTNFIQFLYGITSFFDDVMKDFNLNS